MKAMRRAVLTVVSIAVIAVPGVALAQRVHFEGAVIQGPTTRPHALSLTADGTLEVSQIRWRSWGRNLASGRGTAEYHGCTPSCGQGIIHQVVVATRLSDIVRCGGRLWYNHVRLIKPTGASLDPSYLRGRNWAPCELDG